MNGAINLDHLAIPATDGYRQQIQAHSPDGGPNLTEETKWANIQSARSLTRWERE